uniref:CBM11 domain-containing protein n=1 Tax=Eiseniibacteriota bacterium TaxID=2212470 RepID=A0A832MNE2_UNCEI
MGFGKTLQRVALVALTCAGLAGCGRDSGVLEPWPLDDDPVVFADAFTGRVEFQAFGNSKLDALGTDAAEQYLGAGCLRVTVPGPGAYAGGAFVASRARDLSGYNALTFYVKASRAVTVDVVGLGNDNTGGSRHEASTSGLPVTTAWRKVVVPIPDPDRLTHERGLFFFAAAPQGGAGYTLWFDEVRFEKVAGIESPRPAITPQTIQWFVGSTVSLTGTRTTFRVDGADLVVQHMPGYFDYASSDSTVAVARDGRIEVLGTGTASITARLDTTRATGAVTLNAAPFSPGLAPRPGVPAADVISLFSDAYANVPVDKWSADWDVAETAEIPLGSERVRRYTNMSFAGIEFISRPVDASAMGYFHMDVWAPAGTTFRVKLVDFGPNGVFGGGDDSQHELTWNAASIPRFRTNAWLGLEVPLSAFTGLTRRAHLAQLILSGDTRTLYVDNIYFHR